MLASLPDVFYDKSRINKEEMICARSTIFKKRSYTAQQFRKFKETLCHPVYPSLHYPMLNDLARNGNHEELSQILATPFPCDKEEGKILWWQEINKQDFLHRTALHEASEKGFIDTVIMLLEHGADPNLVDAKAQTCLHYAAWRGYYELSICLMESMHTDSINSQDLSGNTALHIALHQKNYKIAVKLLTHNCDIQTKNKIDQTPFDIAYESKVFDFHEASNSNLELDAFIQLLEYSPNTAKFTLYSNRVKPSESQTELIIQQLLCTKRVCTQNYFHRWMLNDQIVNIERILKVVNLTKEQVNEVCAIADGSGNSVFHIAARRDQFDGARLLLDRCCSQEALVTQVNHSHESPILIAAQNSNWKLFEFLCSFVTPEMFKKTYTSSTGANVLRYAAETAPISIFSIFVDLLDAENIAGSHFTTAIPKRLCTRNKRANLRFNNLLKQRESDSFQISGLLALSIIFDRKDIFNECVLTKDLINSCEGIDQSSRQRPMICLAFDLERWEFLRSLLENDPQPDLTITDNCMKTIIDRCMKNKGNRNVIELLPLILANYSFADAVQSEEYRDPRLFAYYIGGYEYLFQYYAESLDFINSPLAMFQVLCIEFENETAPLHKLVELYNINRSNWEKHSNDTENEAESDDYCCDDILVLLAKKAPVSSSLSPKKKARITLMKRIANFLIPLAVDFHSAFAIELLCQKGYWKESHQLFNVINNNPKAIQYWKNEGKSILFSSCSVCVAQGQVGLLLSLIPILYGEEEILIKLLNIAALNGRSEVAAALLLKNSTLSTLCTSKLKLYTVHKRRTLREKTNLEFTCSPFRYVGEILETGNPLEEILIGKNLGDSAFRCCSVVVSDFLRVWRSWGSISYLNLNFLQACAFAGSSDCLLLILSLVEPSQRDDLINDNQLIQIALVNGYPTLASTILQQLEGKFQTRTKIENYSLQHPLCYAVRQTDEPNLVRDLLMKGASPLSFEMYGFQLYTFKLVSCLYFAVPGGFAIPNSPKQRNTSFNMMFSYVKEILSYLSSHKEIVKCLSSGEQNLFSFLSVLILHAPAYVPGDDNEFHKLSLWIIDNYPSELREAMANTEKTLNGILGISQFALKGYWEVLGELFRINFFSNNTQTPSSVTFLYNQALMQQRIDAVKILSNLHFDLSNISLWKVSLYRATRNIEICRVLLQDGFSAAKLLANDFIYFCIDISVFRLILGFCEVGDFEDVLVVNHWMHIVAAYGSLSVWKAAKEKQTKTLFWQSLNARGESLLMSAANNGNSEVILDLIESLNSMEFTDLKNKQNCDGNTALHFACRSGDLKTVQLLADHHSILVVNKRGDNPSFEAWSRGKCEIVRYLRKFFDVGPIKYNKNLYRKQTDVGLGWFHYLIKINAQNQEKPSEANDFLFCSDSFTIERNLVEAKVTAGVDCVIEYLKKSIQMNKIATLDYLLKEEKQQIEEYILSAFVGDKEKFSVLLVAARSGHFEIVDLILRFYQSMSGFSFDLVRQVDELGNSLLHWATSHSWVDFSFYIAEKFSLSWSQENKMKETPLCLAIFVGKFDFSKIQKLPPGCDEFIAFYEELFGDMKKTNSFLSLQQKLTSH